mmetsp:Transcript_20692/g.19717  ORF Transcript_20692/g.19717 Transcript_20692/m.19717 type:complete len:138 (-) Transcript_20692:1935-2348(-)
MQQQLQQQRKQVKRNYEEIERTNEYMETHYDKIKTVSTFNALMPINSFWVDFASHLLTPSPTFLSGNFFLCYEDIRASFMVLALMDLPFEAVQHDYASLNRGITLTPASDFILFQKEVKEADLNLQSEIIVNHRYVI